MLVFIDESGDTGLDLTCKVTSPKFIVTLVMFEEREQAVLADQRIQALKTALGLRQDFEFHFSKLKPDWKRRFLREVSGFEFFYFSVVLDKSGLSDHGIQTPRELYRYTCGLVFELAKPYLRDATVVLDGQGSELLRRELSSFLRQKIQADGSLHSVIYKVKLQDSHKNNLLQLADMVCGAVARSLTDKPDAQDYRKIISHREMQVSHWPK
ncbi:MAG: DUF3800 domain-containing protein [Prosthecobacter sp.]|nr:DUF3800 domain-containing protein [Prosthecobacter sp.]